MKKLFLILVLVLMLSSNLYALDLFQRTPRDTNVSDFTLSNLSGENVSLSDAQSKGVILFFWTTWCPNCRNELSRFNEKYKDLEASGIELFAIDVGESRARVQSFVNRKSIQYPILLDQDSSVAQKYGIIGVPTIILISRQGEVVSVAHVLPDNYKKLLLE